MNTHTIFSARIMKSIPGLFAVVVFAMLASGCEDEPPTDYVPMPYVEAYLFVDRPITNVVVAISQPLTSPYTYGNGSVADAQVTITGGGKTYTLQYHEINGAGSYFYPDTNEVIQPDTEYNLEVRLKDGKVLTAATLTPQRIAWVAAPKDVAQYPSDTVRLPLVDSLAISWTKGNNSEYLVRVTRLDTLNYGAYLTPPTGEMNERTNANGEDSESRDIYSSAMWGFLQATTAPMVWRAFRWYGMNEVAIIAPDKHFLNWFKLTQFSGNPATFNDQFSNIRGGGVGVFGSGAIVTKNLFLLKRVK